MNTWPSASPSGSFPTTIIFVEEIPHTATGKIQKLTLRERFAGYKLPTL